MKSIIICLIFIAVQPLSAQSFSELIKKYEKECSKLVPDTIDQEGTVTYDLVPVLDAKGKILHYALGKPDTVWNAPNCLEYKNSANVSYGLRWNSNGYWSDGITNLSLTTYATAGPIQGSEHTEKTRVKVTRQYICEVKQREVEPFSEHFWNWIKKQ